MELYIFYVVSILLGLFLLGNKSGSNYAVIIHGFLFIVVVFFYSFRGDTVGTDTREYIDIFYKSHQLNLVDSKIEPLFLIFNYVIHSFCNSVVFYFFCISSIFYTIWLIGINNLVYEKKQIAWGVVLLYYPYLSLFNITRQALAISVCVLAISFLIKNRLLLFLFTALASIFIHYTSLFLVLTSFIVIWLLKRYAISPVIYLLFPMIILFLVWIFQGVSHIDYFLNDKYSNYLEFDNNRGVTGIFLILLYMIKIVVFYFIYFKYRCCDFLYKFFLSLYSLGFSLLLFLKLNEFPDEGPVRLVLYFSVFEVFLFPYLVTDFLNRKNIGVLMRFLFYCFLIFSFLYSIYSGAGGMYPYVFNSELYIF